MFKIKGGNDVKRKLLALPMALLMILSTGCATQNQQSSKKKQQPIQGVESSISRMGDIQRVKITTATSNVRSGCSTSASVLQPAGKNSTLDVVSKVADWYAVKLPNNSIGFVHSGEATPVVVDTKQPTVASQSSAGAPQATSQGNATASNAPKTPAAQTNSSTPTSQEQQMLTLINQARAQNNVPALQIDMQVTNVARIKAQDMIDNNYFSHNSPKYGSPFDMLKAFGVSYVQAGENIAGNQTVQAAENALMNSPGHRANILNPAYTHIGIGFRAGGPYGNMISQMFVSKPK